MCGGSEPPCVVREDPRSVGCSAEMGRILRASAASVSSALGDGARVLRETACYLPVTDTGDIVAGALADGVFVAMGHGCWGILNGPATGEGMAEMLWSHISRAACSGSGAGGGGRGGRGGCECSNSAAGLLKPFAPIITTS